MNTTFGRKTASGSPGRASPARSIAGLLRRWAKWRGTRPGAAEAWPDTIPTVWADTLATDQAEHGHLGWMPDRAKLARSS